VEVTAVGQRFKVRLPVEIDVNGVDDQVKLARQRVQRLGSRLFTTLSAPIASTSFSFAGFELNAVTSQPIACSSLMAICPDRQYQ
jgi:hypothetical protein